MANERLGVVDHHGLDVFANVFTEAQAAAIKEALTEAQAIAVASAQASKEAADKAIASVDMLFVGSQANNKAIYDAFCADPTAESVTVEVDDTCPAAVYDDQQQKYMVTVYRWQTVCGGYDMGGQQA